MSDVEQPVGKPGDVVARSGRRLAVQASEWLSDWYISHSPRNDNQNAEGPWQEWVDLAHAILLAEQERVRNAGPGPNARLTGPQRPAQE